MALKVAKVEKDTVANTPLTWVSWEHGASFEIYGINNPLYRLAVDRLDIRITQEDLLNLNEASPTVNTQIGIVGKYLVNDWQGVTDEDGEALELNPENFENLILNYPDLFGWILKQSVEIQRKHYVDLDKVKKKSQTATNGKSNTKA